MLIDGSEASLAIIYIHFASLEAQNKTPSDTVSNPSRE